MAENAGTIYASIELRLSKLEAAQKKTNSILDQIANRSKQRASGFEKAWTSAFTAFGFLGAQAINKVLNAIKGGASVFAGFQQSIANVVSVTKAFGEEQRLVEKAAKDAGETTRFSARQAADALYFLASAGLDARQSIDALDGVLQLAGATQSDLASTASTVTAVLSQYNLQAAEAERVSNVFAAAIANSQANMQKLTGAFRQVGPVAAGLGLSLEETTGALQLLFNAGFQGQQAGRALKSALADLASPTANITKIFDKLNINLEKVNPTTNDFASIIDELAKSGATTADIIDSFGKVAGPQIAVLVQQGADAIRDYTDAVTGTNAAAEAYAIQNETLQGTIDILRSKAEGLAIAFFGKLDPGLRKIINSFINLIEKSTPLIEFFGNLLNIVIDLVSGPLDALAEGLGLISSIFNESLTTYEKVTEEFDKVRDSIKELGEIDNTVNKLNKLTSEYESLSSKAELTEKEQGRLKTVISEIGKIVPQAATAFDEYGNAIAISTEKTKESAKQLLETRRAVILEAKARLDFQKPLLQNILDERLEEAKSLKERRKAISENAAIARERLAIINTFNLRYEKELERLGGREDIAFRNIAKRLQSDFREAGISLEVFDKEVGFLIQDTNTLNIITKQSERALAELVKAAKEEPEVIIQVEDAQKKLQELANLEKELEGIQAGLNDLDKIDPIKEDAPKKADELKKKTEDIWQSILKDLEKAIREARIFGDEQDVLKAKIDFLRDAYLDLLDKGLDPVSETMTRIKKLYDDSVTALEALTQKQDEFFKTFGTSKDKAMEAVDALNAFYGSLEQRGAFQEFKKNAELTFDEIKDIISSSSDALSSFFNFFDQISKNILAGLGEQLQAELEAAGLAEETNLERINKEIETAKAAGDEEKIVELEKEKKKEEIKAKFEKKKAQIEYQAALASWTNTVLSASAKLAEAIITAYNAGPFPFNLPAIAFATGAGVNVATAIASKPQPPKFQTGGIVPGNQLSGDNIPALLNSREGIFTLQDQRNLFDLIRNLGNNGQVTNQTIRIPLELDGDIITERVVNDLNSGKFSLNPDGALK